MKRTVFAVASLLMLNSFNTSAQNSKNLNDSYPDYDIPFYMEEGIKMSLKNNTPLVFGGLKDPVEGATPFEMAENWIAKNATEIKLKDLSDLQSYFKHSGPAGHTVRYRQYYEGVPVFNAEVVVHISPKNLVTFVNNTYDPSIEGLNVVPTVSAGDAEQIAIKDLDAKLNEHSFLKTELMVYNREVQALVYKVIIEPEAPLGSWELIVNAHDGSVIRKANKTCNHGGHDSGETCENVLMMPPPPPVTGTGNIFDPDPLSVAGVQYGAPYNDAGDATNASFDATMSNVPLLDIDFDGTNYHLVGPYAEVVDHENPFKGLFSQTSSSFNFNRNNDAFEAVNCYYHLDKSLRYINDTLIIACMPFQYSGGVRFDPSGWNGADNSSYSGGSGRLSFGEGGVDDGEDADVILHELGHGIHDWITGGNLSQVNGLSEGSGDYWAVSYSRSKNQWTSADPEYFWVFSWDGHNQFWNGRTTNYGASYPGGLVGQIHTDGQIWATCLMRIWEQLGRTKVDAAFLEGLAMTGSSTSQQDAAIAVRQAAIDMGYSCADVDVFTVEFTATGYNMPPLTPPSSTLATTLCSGQSITVNGTVYNESNPSGTEVIPGTTAACDSTVTINLTFTPAPVTNLNNTLCFGDSVVVNGTVYNESNPTGSEILSTQNGCDSTVNVSLTFSNALSSTVNGPICQGESITVNGNVYDYNNPTGTEIFPNVGQSGCDSTVTIDLTPVDPSSSSVSDQLCSGESMVINGTLYNESNPSGTEVLQNAVGCDSTITVNLTFDPAINISVTNNSPTLSAVATGATYQWIDCNNGNAAIPGETDQSFTATSNGNYAVEITIGNCTETSTCMAVNNVGLDDATINSLIVYPNPSTGLFIIETDATGSLDYVVTTVDGKIVREKSSSEPEQISVDLSSESRGVYMLRVQQNDQYKVFKLILE